jgi:hypothetical protein
MRTLVWFSCGAASAYAAKLSVERRRDTEVVYCDTLKYENSDNVRFLRDCERWIGKEIKLLRSDKYTDIFDVFDKTGWLVGPGGARCTTELKKKVRRAYQTDGDTHVFGYTSEEQHRADHLAVGEPDLRCEFPLIDRGFTKEDCLKAIYRAGIELPMMYRMGYANNNCIGCVKGGAGYWNKIRFDFPEAFARMAKQERKMDVAINKTYIDGKRINVFLDELPVGMGNQEAEPNIECGVLCLA